MKTNLKALTELFSSSRLERSLEVDFQGPTSLVISFCLVFLWLRKWDSDAVRFLQAVSKGNIHVLVLFDRVLFEIIHRRCKQIWNSD